MAHYLPAAMMQFFVPRPLLEIKKPVDKRKMPPYHGVSQFVGRFGEVANDEYKKTFTRSEVRAKRRANQSRRQSERIQRHAAKCMPLSDDDPLKLHSRSISRSPLSTGRRP